MKILLNLFMLCMCMGSLFAQDIKIVGTIQRSVDMPMQVRDRMQLQNTTQKQIITLLELSLSDKAKQHIFQKMSMIKQHSTPPKTMSTLPDSVQLGMENVPVSNQGVHGSCVVFAVTAALDAVLKKADKISELCTLELGSFLQNNGFISSGWNGSLSSIVLAQIDAFGFMTKQQQREIGCGGLKEYPVLSYDTGHAMTLPEFHQYSQSLVQNRIGWTALLDMYQTFNKDLDAELILGQVKNALSQGDRLTFGILLADYEKGLAGAMGYHKSVNDTWLLTPEIIQDTQDTPQFAGHEMIITGYDDHAMARDDHGRVYYGLLTLRNSWGDKIGYKGDFYMSYDYFKELVIELQRIRQINDNE